MFIQMLLLKMVLSGSYLDFDGIGVVDTNVMDTRDIDEAFDYCALKNYEGFVICDPSMKYTPGKRNRGYLKLKHPKHREE